MAAPTMATMTETPPVTTAATFCATLVDEWMRAGLTYAAVAPGSRSTPMALALAAQDNIAVHVFHDERAGAFAALGHGLATGKPAVVLCSSGTAGTHFHAAVVEADLSSVPLLVVTADRPPKLWDVGAPQVIDQTHLYGDVVRAFLEPGVPDSADANIWRSLAATAWNAATGSAQWPGPVHLNLSFADPLVGESGALPPGRDAGAPWHQGLRHHQPLSSGEDVASIAGRVVGRTGVIVAGGGTSDPAAVLALAQRLGWPVLADHRSGCRRADASISCFDALLRDPQFAESNRPQVILRFGQILSSKALSQWIAASDADVIVARTGRVPSDPERVAQTFITEAGLAIALLDRLPPTMTPAPTLKVWKEADKEATAAMDPVLAGQGWSEPAMARAVLNSIGPDDALMLSSSMPVRDVEWYGGPRTGIRVFSNRGANGIDGVVATAIGIATTGLRTTVLIGDVAFLHDSTALIALAGRNLNLTIVVCDNDGGGIFSFLPQRKQLADERFEQLFGTPHGTDLEALARAHGLTVEHWTEDLPELTPRGVRIIIAPTDRAANVAHHDALNAAVANRD